MLPRSSKDILANAVRSTKTRPSRKKPKQPEQQSRITNSAPLPAVALLPSSAMEGIGPTSTTPEADVTYMVVDGESPREGLQAVSEVAARLEVEGEIDLTPDSETIDIIAIQKLLEPARVPRAKRISDALDVLKDGNLSPFDLILEVLDESNAEHWGYRTAFYRESNSKLAKILETIMSSSSGHDKLMSWIRSHAVSLVKDIIEDEMDAINEANKVSGLAEAIKPEYIEAWDLSRNTAQTPVLTEILLVAAQTSRAREENKKKRPFATCNMIVSQLRYQRSNRSLGSQTIFGIFLWSNGCSRQTIDALHRCGLAVSYSSVLKAVEELATHCMLLAVAVALTCCFGFCYDNINISTSIFVEQRGRRGPTKVTSGTFGVVYKLRNAVPHDMKLAPIMERARKADGLDFNRDLRPSMEQLTSVHNQFKAIIVRVLTTYCPALSSHKSAPDLQHKPRRPMPSGHITEFFPIRATTIEEASVRGNILYHDDVFLNQLKMTQEQLSEIAVPSFNDQMTNSRIRSAQILRALDLNGYTRREFFQLGPGFFHLLLNLVWGIFHTYRGTLASTGCLEYFFSLMDKKRLNGEHPDFHSLHSALMQILDGVILNLWRTETGYQDLAKYAAEKKPTAQGLLDIAEKILVNHTTPLAHADTAANTASESDDEHSDESDLDEEQDDVDNQIPGLGNSSTSARPLDPSKDATHQNLRLLTRDLIYVAELTRAISDGDIGRIEDILPQLAMLFRGMGGNNYCTEILHFIHNLKHVWTPEFANIMRDNSLVNVSGLDGHSMGVDLNIEHLIKELKDLLEAKGMETTWDRLGNISASVHLIKKLKRQVSLTMSLSYQSKTHTTPNTDHLVWLVADDIRDKGLDIHNPNRRNSSNVVPVVDTIAEGEQKLKSSSIATFNRKVKAMANGQEGDYSEQDTLPPVAISVTDPTVDASELNLELDHESCA